jgi:hypothetical protein
MAVVPRPGLGGLSPGAIGRGLFRKGGQRPRTSFTFVPEWERNTLKEVGPSGKKQAEGVHRLMSEAMAQHSRRAPGGGSGTTDKGWEAGIGSPPQTHTHWHLIEFGGGNHYARAPVRRVLNRAGKFEPSGRP